MNTYCYRIYNLTILSEFECPGLPKGEGEPDVFIRIGQNLKCMSENDHENGVIFKSSEVLLLRIKRVGSFRIAGGREVMINKIFDVDDDLVRVYLLGSVLGVILYQRELLPLHGNAISTGDSCIAFLGHSGKGKSTLAAAFMRRGYKTLSDDICTLNILPSKIPVVLPGIPNIRLWEDSLNKLEIDSSKLHKAYPGEEKFQLPIGMQYINTPLPLKYLFILDTHKEQNFRIETLSILDRMRLIKTHSYRTHLPAKMGISQRHFSQCSDIVEHIPILQIFRPEESFLIEELVDLIEKEFLDIANIINRNIHT